MTAGVVAPDLAHMLLHLREAYGMPLVGIEPLSLGNDAAAAVFVAESDDHRRYFLKAKRGSFDPAGVVIPRFLRDQGMAEVVAPLPARSGALWSDFGGLTLALYPFVDGVSAWDGVLTDSQWRTVGAALRRLHCVHLPVDLLALVQRESYAPWARDLVRDLLRQTGARGQDSAARQALADFLAARRTVIERVIDAAEQLAERLQRTAHTIAGQAALVLCHSDLHRGNLMVDVAGGVSIVDWDSPILAPKERDLMFIGANVGGPDPNPRAGEMFRAGYGPTEIDAVALAYFRYERIVQDFADYCGRAFGGNVVSIAPGSDEDTLAALHDLRSQFDAANVIAAADEAASRI